MNKNETYFFGIIGELFGEKTSKIIYNLYIDFIHDIKMFGVLLSLPFKFVKFFIESYKEYGKKKGVE